MSDSEIAELCRRIYERHKRALDLIFEHRPDQEAMLQTFLGKLVQSTPELILDSSSTHYIRFAPSSWNTPTLLLGEGWSGTRRMLLFEFRNDPQRIDLRLIVGPGPAEIRQRLIDLARQNGRPFAVKRGTTEKWSTIFSKHFLHAGDYEGTTLENIEERIQDSWDIFRDQDLPKIMFAIAESGLATPAMDNAILG